MEVAGVLAVVGMLAAWVGTLGWSLLKSNRRSRVLREVGETLGLKPKPGASDLPATLSGVIDGFEVTIVNPHNEPLRIEARGGLPSDVELRPRDLLSAEVLSKRPWRAPTGDWELDSKVNVNGNVETALALLRSEDRRAVAWMISAGSELRDGCLTSLHLDPVPAPWRVVSAVREATRLGRLLVSPPDLVGRLIHGALHDPVPGFRARCVEVLRQRHADDARVADTFSRCLDDPSELVRLATAGGPLSPAGRAAVLGLTLAVLARGPDPEETEVELAALGALGALGGEEAERSLLAALNAVEPELRRAAARALGTSGSTRATPALRAAAAAHNDDWPLLNAVTATIVAIQERAGASPGQLALAGSEAGEVALAEGVDTGRVALTEGES